MNDTARAVDRPEFQAQVGVIAHDVAMIARMADGGQTRFFAILRDCLTDRREMEGACARNRLQRQLSRRDEARGGSLAEVAENMSLSAVPYEVDSCAVAGAPDHRRTVDPLLIP